MPRIDYRKLCGRYIGCGSFRQTYLHKKDATKVIKVARPRSQERALEYNCLHNWLEYYAWHSAPTEVQQYLAQVHDISSNGKYLVMDRVLCGRCPTSASKWLPEPLQRIFDDVDGRNTGLLYRDQTRPVISDYALFSPPGWRALYVGQSLGRKTASRAYAFHYR